MDQRQLGAEGERLAADYLRERGFKVLESNWCSKFGEIDLICQEGEEIVFVEVKTRLSLESGYPEDSVTEAKRRHLQAAGECYLMEQQAEKSAYRFDVISIVMTPWGESEILHLPGI